MSSVDFGPATLTVPDGFTEATREGERITFLHDDKLEHVTISYRHFPRNPSFAEFQALCEQRLKTEREALDDGFLEERGPSENDDGYTLIFFGGDRATARMFSGLLIVVVDTLLAIYCEGFDLEPARHQATFAAFAQGWSLTPRSAS